MSDNPRVGSLIVVTGPPGAGKSTVAQILADHFKYSVLVEGDQFFGFVRSSRFDPWLPDAHTQNTVVIGAAAAAVGSFVLGGYDTVYDGIIGPWFLPTFAAGTGLDSLDYVVLLPTVECCVERVARRTRHEFSDEAATRHMHEEFEGAEIESRHVLSDPPEGVEATTEAVLARLAAGTLRYSVQ
jgi:cytidylate kinase